MPKNAAPPAATADAFNAIAGLLKAFCDEHLDAECLELALKVALTLARKRPSPLLQGKPAVWAAGIVHAIAAVNFLFDRSRSPHTDLPAIRTAFSVCESTVHHKSKWIREALGMRRFDHRWLLPSRLDANPMAWTLMVNGFFVDVRRMPREVQEIAFEKGLIPYITDDGPPGR